MSKGLRDLLREQRSELDGKSVVPTQSYLTQTSPFRQRRPQSGLERAAAPLIEESEFSLLRPPSVPLRTNALLLDGTATTAANGDGSGNVPKSAYTLRGALEHALDMLEASENISAPCTELLNKINAISRKQRRPAEEKTPAATSLPLSMTPQVNALAPLENDSGKKRLRLFFHKLKVISTAPELYRDMVESREAIEKLYDFTIECTTATFKEDFISWVVDKTREVAGAEKCRYIKSSHTLTKTDSFHMRRSQSEAISNRISVPLQTPKNHYGFLDLTFEEGKGPFSDNEKALERLVSLLDGMASVVALSIQNHNSFILAEQQREKAEAMLTMANRLAADNLDEDVLVRSIMDSAQDLVASERCRLFLVSGSSLTAYVEDGSKVSIDVYTGAEGEVARTGAIVNMTDAYNDPRFDSKIDKVTGTETRTMLCLPVQCEGQIVAVAQLINKIPMEGEDFAEYNDRDVDLFMTFATFIGVSVRNCRLFQQLGDEKRKSEGILDVVKQLSNSDIRDVQSVVRHAMKGAKSLLNADRATLFLVDKERNELYSTMADYTAGKEIRTPIGTGIAGTVAAKMQGENISDAYADPRFNRKVDVSMGYVTRSMLTEPIIFQDECLAVAQLVNKIGKNGDVQPFTEDDKATFKAFSLFAGISISNSHLLEFAINAGREAMNLHQHQAGIGQRKQSYRVISEFSDEATKRIMNLDIPDEIMSTISSRNFSLFEVREKYDEQGKDYASKILAELIIRSGYPKLFRCPDETVYRFVLACRTKYRSVPYHNFFHAVDVCQTVLTFIKEGRIEEVLSELECYVLLITAVVHDLDHMGLNNSFHLKTDSPLGMLSSASGNNSVLEVHHCNLAINILEDPNQNVFCGLDSEESHVAFKLMIECVLATDMARHKELCDNFKQLSARGSIHSQSPDDDIKLTMQMLTKAADISNVTKPFDISRLWGMCVTEEFYQQGDKEKAKGVEVAPMFDRTKNTELANGQIGFIDFIAKPFFDMMKDALPGMRWCAQNIDDNRSSWSRTLVRRQSASLADSGDK